MKREDIERAVRLYGGTKTCGEFIASATMGDEPPCLAEEAELLWEAIDVVHDIGLVDGELGPVRNLDPPDPGPSDDELRVTLMHGMAVVIASITSSDDRARYRCRAFGEIESLLTEHRRRQAERAKGGDDGE